MQQLSVVELQKHTRDLARELWLRLGDAHVQVLSGNKELTGPPRPEIEPQAQIWIQT